MGLLNNWLKKKKKEQLKQTSEKAGKVEVKALKEKKEAPASDAVAANEKKHILPMSSLAHKVLLKPLVTEKSAVAESVNKYSFLVATWASKKQIKQAVKDAYKVVPVGVNVINVEGRRVRFGRGMGRRSDYKKAIVTLPQGKTIDIHTGV